MAKKCENVAKMIIIIIIFGGLLIVLESKVTIALHG